MDWPQPPILFKDFGRVSLGFISPNTWAKIPANPNLHTEGSVRASFEALIPKLLIQAAIKNRIGRVRA